MMLPGTLRLLIHAALFLIAIVVFFLGLGIGLQYNPQLGTALWLAAGVIVAINLVWIIRGKPTPSR